MDVKSLASAAKSDSFLLAGLSASVRDDALSLIASGLSAGAERIFSANAEDLAAAEAEGLAAPIVKRLRFDKAKLDDALAGISDLMRLSDPLGRRIFTRELDEGLVLEQVSCPIGVIGVIFESRPDALVQIACLAIKSGNCVILKGGSEAANTNRVLAEIIREAGISAGLPSGFITLLESRSEITELLSCPESVDLIIPRGSNEFVRYIMDHSDIAVMGHADGICHVYVDAAADLEMAVRLVRDSKVQYVAVCNAVETVLVHSDAADEFLPMLAQRLEQEGVVMKGSPRTVQILAGVKPEYGDLEQIDGEDFRTEHLDYIVSIRVVDSLDEAVAHINKYGSHHTDCIVTRDDAAAEWFMNFVDSAGVYRNCSTRFADGYRYGFGAEVGVSTGKLHARGPVGLDGLTTYKYRLTGHGHVVADYAEGRKQFHFKEL
jgi:glutamate-5-semialdehyde dehydrogenase